MGQPTYYFTYGGVKLNNDWEIGVRFRYSGGPPYTPYDTLNSSLKYVWDINSFGLFDYNRLNGERLKANHGLDIRIDKKWYWNKVALNVYIDIQNAYNFQGETPPSLIAVTTIMETYLKIQMTPLAINLKLSQTQRELYYLQ